jgi:hypothetical protein
MQMPKYFIITLLLILGYSNKADAQYGFSHEVGLIVGPVAFQSDYGERHDFNTNAGIPVMVSGLFIISISLIRQTVTVTGLKPISTTTLN